DPSQARGLLLLQARNPALLQRLIRVVNTSQQQSGELARIGQRRRAGMTYYVREFPPGTERLPEWYVDYPDGTFAFSNSETLIQAVIDRRSRMLGSPGGAGPAVPGERVDPGLGELPRLQAVQRRLPGRALARLFVDPRPLGRLLAAAERSGKPDEVRVR